MRSHTEEIAGAHRRAERIHAMRANEEIPNPESAESDARPGSADDRHVVAMIEGRKIREAGERLRAVAHASAEEIDAVGILRALRLAGERALAQLPRRPDHVLLDGSYDWVSRPAPTLFDDDGLPADPDSWVAPPPVTVKVKADLTCSSVAAASVLAKTTRDTLMVELAASFPAYGWDVNKGYASPEHLDALRAVGPCELHRRSWAIPGGRGDTAADDLLCEDEDVDLRLAVGSAPSDRS